MYHRQYLGLKVRTCEKGQVHNNEVRIPESARERERGVHGPLGNGSKLVCMPQAVPLVQP